VGDGVNLSGKQVEQRIVEGVVGFDPEVGPPGQDLVGDVPANDPQAETGQLPGVLEHVRTFPHVNVHRERDVRLGKVEPVRAVRGIPPIDDQVAFPLPKRLRYVRIVGEDHPGQRDAGSGGDRFQHIDRHPLRAAGGIPAHEEEGILLPDDAPEAEGRGVQRENGRDSGDKGEKGQEKSDGARAPAKGHVHTTPERQIHRPFVSIPQIVYCIHYSFLSGGMQAVPVAPTWQVCPSPPILS